MKEKSNLIKPIYDFFISSSDYNGIEMEDLFKIWNVNWVDGIYQLISLIEQDHCIIQSSTLPYIIRNSIPTKEASINYLNHITKGKGANLLLFKECIYPSPSFLRKHRNVDNLAPYERYLALGGAHLNPIFFKFEVINSYLYDPRFVLELKDYHGSLKYELKENSKLDKTGYYDLKTFGLGYNEKGIRVIVSFPRYLSRLSKSQQNLWESYEIANPSNLCKVYKPYWDNIMDGSWGFPQSLASGILNERKYINKLWKEIFDDVLFQNDFSIEELPPYFSFLFLPTNRSLGNFIHLMDKLFSDQLNTKHLRDLIINGKEGYHRITKKFDSNIGSLNAFELWLDNIYHLKNGDDFGKIIVAPFKEIRKLRQPIAHKIENPDFYDINFYDKQTEILRKIYNTLVNLRIVLVSHPRGINVKPPISWSEKVYNM